MIKRLYRGDRRTAIKFWRSRRRDRRLLKWALSVRPGDYIGTCEGCNRKVVKVEPQFIDAGHFLDSGTSTGTEVLHEVRFVDTNGRWHYCPGGGCAFPPEPPEKVTSYFRDWATDPGSEERIRHWYGEKDDNLRVALGHWRKMLRAIRSGDPIVDGHGELLPEFDLSKRDDLSSR